MTNMLGGDPVAYQLGRIADALNRIADAKPGAKELLESLCRLLDPLEPKQRKIALDFLCLRYQFSDGERR